MRRLALRALGCVALFGLDRALAWLAVEADAAGALLSPGGAVPLGSFAIAGAFVATRLAFSLGVAVTVALAASEAVRWGWNLVGSRSSPTRS